MHASLLSIYSTEKFILEYLYPDHALHCQLAATLVTEYVLHSTVSVFGYEIGLWHVVAVMTFPVSFLKQVVSLVQLVVASQNIGVFDANERKKNRKQ